MITVKKDAIKYKSSDGTMKDSGVLCQVGVVDASAEFNSDWWVNGFNGLTNYSYKFAEFQNDTIPFIDTSKGKNFSGMFQNSKVTHIPLLDTSKGTNFVNMFSNSDISEVPPLDLSNATSVSSMFNMSSKKGLEKLPSFNTKNVTHFSYFIYYAPSLKEVGKLNLSSAVNVEGLFGACDSLEDVSFVENSIKISIKFNSCPLLSAESIQSIIDGLADLTGSTAQTLTLHATVKAKLTESQISQITSKNWTLA